MVLIRAALSAFRSWWDFSPLTSNFTSELIYSFIDWKENHIVLPTFMTMDRTEHRREQTGQRDRHLRGREQPESRAVGATQAKLVENPWWKRNSRKEEHMHLGESRLSLCPAEHASTQTCWMNLVNKHLSPSHSHHFGLQMLHASLDIEAFIDASPLLWHPAPKLPSHLTCSSLKVQHACRTEHLWKTSWLPPCSHSIFFFFFFFSNAYCSL